MPSKPVRAAALGLVPLLLASLLLCACGSSSGSSSAAPPLLIEARAEPVGAGEGYILNNAIVVTASETVIVGDSPIDLPLVGVLTFDIALFSNVQSATLQLVRTAMDGDPFALGTLWMDHIDSEGVLDLADLAGGTLQAEMRSLPDLPDYSIDVTAQVQADLAAGRTTSAFRLRFDTPSDLDGANDNLRIGSSKNALDPNRPVLVIEYASP